MKFHNTVCLFLAVASTASANEPQSEGLAHKLVANFATSEFVFPKAQSNAPFAPLAGLGFQAYGDTEVKGPDGNKLKYDVTRITQNAMLPIQLGKRDALVVGEYLSHSRFNLSNSNADSFEVNTVGLPVGWFRQANEDWQLGGFIMPLGNKSSEHNSDWNFQYLGGVFSRYEHSAELWWAFGFYFDVSKNEDFYIPYIGAAWTINPRWTLSAIMPWPGLVYSPTQDWSFRLGAAPSGASWSIAPQEDEISYNFSSWDLGLSANRRIYNNIWARLEAGFGGLSTLRISDSNLEEPEFDLGSSQYISVAVQFRPSLR